MQPIPRQIEIAWPGSLIQMSKNIGDPSNLVSTDPAGVAVLVQPPETAVPERSNHQDTVSCTDTGVKPVPRPPSEFL